MKKTVVDPTKLKEVLELKQLGATWSAIERETGVDRRVAKTVFDEWEANRENEEVKKARSRVAAEVFHQHMESLIEFADSLAGFLPTPSMLRDKGDAEAVLTPWWGSDPRTIHRNQLLFQALRQHTGDKGWWLTFKEWQVEWDNCKMVLDVVRKEAYEVVRNLINRNAGLKEEVERKSSQGMDVMKILVADLFHSVEWAFGEGKITEELPLHFLFNRFTLVTEDYDYDFNFELSNVSLGPDILKEIKTSIRTLGQSYSDKGISEKLDTLQGKNVKLGNSLDSLILRPVIIRSWCDLCPI